jgi:hypothetical protein
MMDPTRIGASTNFDEEIWNNLEALAEKSELSFSEKIELWPLFIRRVSILRLIAIYEIFKKTKDLPGSIVECGVFRGQSLSLFRHLVEIFSPGDSLKKIIGFDTFTGFTNLSEFDGVPDLKRAKVIGGWDSENFYPILNEIISIHQQDSYTPRVKRVELIKGDVKETVPQYVKENPGLRISLLNLDLDLYEPTLIALENLFPLVVTGGIVILDEFAMPGFPGESKAAEHFFSDKVPKMQKFGFAPTPSGYFIKE